MSCLKKYVSRQQLTPDRVASIERQLGDALTGRVDKAYVFGSVGDGSFKPLSDIDLILIKESKVPFAQRAMEFLDLFEIYPQLDILVYSHAEFERLIGPAAAGFWRRVAQTMRPLLGRPT